MQWWAVMMSWPSEVSLLCSTMPLVLLFRRAQMPTGMVRFFVFADLTVLAAPAPS